MLIEASCSVSAGETWTGWESVASPLISRPTWSRWGGTSRVRLLIPPRLPLPPLDPAPPLTRPVPVLPPLVLVPKANVFLSS